MSQRQPDQPGDWASPDLAQPRPAPDEVTDFSPTPVPPPVPLPRREGARPTVMVLVATAVALLFLGGLSWWNHYRNAPEATDPPSADGPVGLPGPTRVAPTGPQFYALPLDLCSAADFTRLRPVFDRIGDLNPVPVGDTGAGRSVQCDGSTGNDRVQGAFSFRATVYPDIVSASQAFEGDRKALDQTRVHTFDADGRAAYRYSDRGDQFVVELYDGNLRLRMTWVAAPSDDQVPLRGDPPIDPYDPLTGTCESTMNLLRAF